MIQKFCKVIFFKLQILDYLKNLLKIQVLQVIYIGSLYFVCIKQLKGVQIGNKDDQKSSIYVLIYQRTCIQQNYQSILNKLRNAKRQVIELQVKFNPLVLTLLHQLQII
ncbi:unnamed protein product [Paramecium sonneborni]|uniref:Uncharacterized protein n=1 Tax=Paramecium sonneborni TaxID=65129 RepID=A0A8S1QS60_9CILI|nr:unnamed protein product [Paramecium sonneborni]